MLENVKNLLSDGVTALGGILIVFGLVNLGLTIKDGMQGGGGQLSGALAMIIGGAIVVGAAVYFNARVPIRGKFPSGNVLYDLFSTNPNETKKPGLGDKKDAKPVI